MVCSRMAWSWTGGVLCTTGSHECGMQYSSLSQVSSRYELSSIPSEAELYEAMYARAVTHSDKLLRCSLHTSGPAPVIRAFPYTYIEDA